MQDDLTTSAGSLATLDEVFRRWKCAEGRARPMFWWNETPRENLGKLCLLVSIVFMPLAGIIDGHLIAGTAADRAEIARDGLAVTALLALCWIHGWQLDRLLAHRSSGEARAVSWLRRLRRLVASVPFIGWLAIPWWRRLDESKPGWAFRDQPSYPVELRGAWRPFGYRRFRRFARGHSHPQRRVLFLLVTSLVVVNLSAIHLLEVGETALTRQVALITSVVLHAVGFTCASAHFLIRGGDPDGGESSQRWRALVAVFWLVPVPLVPFFTLIPDVLENDPAPRGSTLVASSFSARTGVGSTAEWDLLRRRLRAAWSGLPWVRRLRGRSIELDVVTEAGTIEEGIAQLSRTRAVCLFCDAACFAWGLLWLGDRIPGGASYAQAILGLLALLALALGIVGLGGMAITAVAGLLRLRDRLPRWLQRSLPAIGAVIYLSFFFGLFLGEGSYRGNLGQVAGVLLAVGASGALVLALPLLLLPIVDLPPESEAQDRLRTLWVMVFTLTAMFGLAMPRLLPPEAILLCPLLAAVAFGSACGVALGASGLKWLLHPREWRDIVGSAWPARTRRRLTLLAATAVLPLASLVTPFWPYLRSGLVEEGSSRRSRSACGRAARK